MRAFYAAVALIVAVSGAGGIEASGVGTAPAGVNPIATVSKIPESISLAPNTIRRAAAPRDGAIRLAQVIAPSVQAPEASTGNPSLPPFKWVGLLVIPNPTPQQPNLIGLCTAQFITSRVLLTAGHCLKDLQTAPVGPWPDPTKGTFWLQYQDQSGITFNIVCGKASPQYTLPANYNSLSNADQNTAYFTALQHDIAMILVNADSPTGTMPYALDWKGKVNRATRVGYPADILDAAIVQQMAGPIFFGSDLPQLGFNSPNLVVQWGPLTDFTGGSSGGAWVVNPDANNGQNTNILVAVTSSELNAYPGGEIAAYLTAAEFNPLLTSVTNGCK